MSRWDDFEEENGNETSRLRADSDVTKEPVVESRSPVPEWRSFVNPRSLDLLEKRSSGNDQELSGILRTLKSALIILVGVGIGLLLGASMFASGISPKSGTDQDKLRLETTRAPTLEPTTISSSPTERPTLQPTRDTNSPVASLDDPRFGVEPFVIDPEHVSRWRSQEKLKEQVRQSLLEYYAKGTQNQKFHELVCEVFPNPPTKYEFPPKTYSPTIGLADQLRHVRQYKFALSEYYHGASPNFSSTLYSGGARDVLLRRLAGVFQEKLRSDNPELTILTMGTSVMSGHDNCRYYTYPLLLERSLKHLFAPWSQLKIQVRNYGQNGDGPNQDAQLLCSPFTHGRADALHLWYPMMPQSEPMIKHDFIYRMIRDNGVQHIHQVDGVDPAFVPEPIDRAGFMSASTRFRALIDWAPKHFWGRRDDGLCHNVTREGAIAVSMQNWHLGPIGFQILVDQVMALYVDALEMALLSLINKVQLLPVPNLSDLHFDYVLPRCSAVVDPKQELSFTLVHHYLCRPNSVGRLKYFCWTGILPQWATGADLLKDAKGTPGSALQPLFPAVSGIGVAEFAWTKVKGPSSYSNAVEGKESHYSDRPDCKDFVDEGFAFRSAAAVETGWLTFTVTRPALTALQGANKMHIYACSAQRDKGYDQLANYSVVFAVNGKVWGEALPGPAGPCVRLNNPNGLDVVAEGTTLGFRFIGWSSTRKISFTVGEILLLGADEAETPVPSRAATYPTHAPAISSSSPTSKVMATDSPTVEESTDVPHPSGDSNDEPTVVPHPGDDDPKRRLMMRWNAPRPAPVLDDAV